MSYAIIRNANYKKSNLAGLYKHNLRKNTNYSNKDITKEKSKYNYSIKSCNTTYANALKILKYENNLQGRITKNTNLVCEFIITSGKEFFDEIGEEETKRYFKTAYDFVAQYKNLGEKYILSAVVHNDESTPHMHLTFVPVVHKKTKEGKVIDKIACSEYWKGKDSYRILQDNFYKYVIEHGFNLERGKQTGTKHIETEKLKEITNYENIKYELNNKVKPIEAENKDLIIKQNKELVDYSNKLKLQLTKSYSLVRNSSILEREARELKEKNIKLQQENKKLKQENNKLKEYINKIFEVVNLLFDFPIGSFKKMIEKFKEKEKLKNK